MTEIWMYIKGFGRKYQISSSGNVRGKNNHPIKTGLDTNGFTIVTLRRVVNGKSKTATRRVHRLVAQHFISNPDGLRNVVHKNGNKRNNYFYNLEWKTIDENPISKYDSIKGSKFYTNGFENRLFKESDKIPDGFYLGITRKKNMPKRRKKSKLKGTKWYTNGSDNIRLKPKQEVPDGYKEGKIHYDDGKKINGIG